MELALRADNKALHDRMGILEAGVSTLKADVGGLKAGVDFLKADNKSIHYKLDKLAQRQEMTWQAVMEIQNELSENMSKSRL